MQAVRSGFIGVIVTALVASAPSPVRAQKQQPVELTLKVSPTAGTTADEYIATVLIELHGINGIERFWPPDFGDFTIVDQRSKQSTQWSYDQNTGRQQVVNQELRRFRLRPTRAGKLKIGGAKVRFDGKDYETKPVVVEVVDTGQPVPTVPDEPSTGGVTQPGGPTPPPEKAAEHVFLFAVADRSKVYEGEQVNVTWYVYTRQDVLKFEPRMPKLDDVVAVKLFEPARFFTWHEEYVGARPYNVAVVSKQALFPTRAGKIVIPPYQAGVATLSSPFGEPERLSSNPVTIEAMPLPAGAPQGFDPTYVGNYQIAATVDRDTVPAGESLLLTLTVKGTGSMQRMKVPPLAMDAFQVYPPRDFEEAIDTSTDVVRGERRYQYLLTPTAGGKQLVGPIELPFFDPQAGKYGLARAEAVPVTVVGDPKGLAASSVGGTGSEILLDKDIRPEHAVPAVASRAAARFGESRWVYLAFGAPPLAYVLAILGDKLRERLRRETPRARLRRARGRARKRLRVAELHVKGGRAAKFFGEVTRVLTEHIEERVGEPVAAMTRDQLREFLSQRGFPEETVDALSRELENCDFARFAPSASGPGEMRAALRRVRALLTAIERVRPSDKGDAAKEAA